MPATMATSLAEGRTLLVVKPVFRGTRDTEPGVLVTESVALGTESGVVGSSSDAFGSPGDGQAQDTSMSASPDEFQEVSFYTNEFGAGLLDAPLYPVWFGLYRLVSLCGVIRPNPFFIFLCIIFRKARLKPTSESPLIASYMYQGKYL